MPTDLESRLLITSYGVELSEGQSTTRCVCPWCKGGSSGKDVFSITNKKGGYFFFCHRASCGKAGVVRSSVGVFHPASHARKQFTPRPYAGATQHLDASQLSFILHAYGISQSETLRLGWRVGIEDRRLIMPVLSVHGYPRGYVAKALDGSTPKSLSFREVDGPWLGWSSSRVHGVHCNLPTIIVEDDISSAKAARHFPAVALHGTHISEDAIFEIIGQSRNIVICLDRDATSKAYSYANKYSLYGNFRVVPLSKDISRMSPDEMEEWRKRVDVQRLSTTV